MTAVIVEMEQDFSYADAPVCVKLIVQKHCPASVPMQKPCSSTKFDAYLMQCNNIVLKSNSMSDENHSLP